jgi:DNA helicase IV
LSSDDIDREQDYVSMLYGRLDRLRERASGRLAAVLRESGGTHQARAEREASTAMYAEQLARFDAAENRLCFGRLDFTRGGRRYIGRLGIHDDSGDAGSDEPLLMDWRAPAARPFYLATAAAPDGVRRRRHIRTSQRTVVGLDDEVLDLTSAGSASAAGRGGLTGEAALLVALTASRTGRMSDIVETIQAEQDRVIRSAHTGVLVVQGGPGTGKTAVALHRAAYLLYTYRRELSRRGVLIVGPNSTFLRYVEQVLPSLGETGVRLTTLGDLYPGVTASRAEPPEVAEVKGRLAMAGVLATAVRDRQRVPADGTGIAAGVGALVLEPEVCARAREAARATRLPHNVARIAFVRDLVDALTRQVADRVGADVRGGPNLLDEADVEEIRRDLREDPAVHAALDALWPILTPRRLLDDLFGSVERLASAAPGLTAAERELLHRAPGGGWTPADVPLLDEAADLLGEDDREATARAERERQARVAAAQGVLDILAGSAPHELDDLDETEFNTTAVDLLDADTLAERLDEREALTVADRAAADREWTYGHVIVDEAQELSEMAWRILMRRCPSRSMTIVGDVAQTGDLAGTSSWERVLAPYVADRWRLARLTVNYRTPAEVMAVAADVLADADAPRSVRHSGIEPWHRRVAPEELATCLGEIVAHAVAEVGDGRLAVLVPASRLGELAGAVPGAAAGPNPDLETPVVVLTVRQAKGLEFDSVLIVEPALMLAESARGRNDLYVALTRTTRHVGVVHTGDLPAPLHRLSGG